MERSSLQDLIRQRTSVRGYKADPIAQDKQAAIEHFISRLDGAPLGSAVRLKWVSGQTETGGSLRGLGTYGMIRNPQAYVIGAVAETPNGVVDFGYQMERVVLELTRLGLGTCWLGGSFTRSRFAQAMDATAGETVPAVVSVGEPLERRTWLDRTTRRSAGSDRRQPWDTLFFLGDFGKPLDKTGAGDWTEPLEMTRLAPSASNRQPWRVVRIDDCFHFYVQRQPSYHRTLKTLKLADLQRLDVGIGMSHFELTARESDLSGRWTLEDPGLALPTPLTEYVATWRVA